MKTYNITNLLLTTYYEFDYMRSVSFAWRRRVWEGMPALAVTPALASPLARLDY